MSTSDVDHLSPGPGVPLRRPLRVTTIVIYVTLALLALTIPRGLVNWLKGFEPNNAQVFGLQAAEGLAAFSHRIGADRAFAAGRDWFLRITGKRDD